MIHNLRKNLIKVCIFAFLLVFVAVMLLLSLVTFNQTNKKLDLYADIIEQNQGKFPTFGDSKPDAEAPPIPNGFNRESPFTTRYFTVKYDKNGQILSVNTDFIASIDSEAARQFGKEVMELGRERGWSGDYRYKLTSKEDGYTAVFVSGISAKESNRNFLLSALSVFLLSSFVIVCLIIFMSKIAVRPAVLGYEKQKQFITNAGHELKTPLALIRTNLDILEEEYGKNEWLCDIRDETLLMSELVISMVALARMDEKDEPEFEEFNLSDAVSETVSVFSNTAKAQGKRISVSFKNDIFYLGNEGSIRQAISVLMDNSVKYCEENGEVSVSLVGEKHPVFTVENSFSQERELDLSRVFDRFYRADKARTWGNGFGIGLSLANAIVEKHRGNISVYRKGDIIGFKIKF